jgi:hypothetical protein
MSGEQKPMAAIIKRVLDAANPEAERSNLNAISFSEFKAAFDTDPIGSLRFYPFG